MYIFVQTFRGLEKLQKNRIFQKFIKSTLEQEGNFAFKKLREIDRGDILTKFQK